MSKLRNYLKGGASTQEGPGTVNTWSAESSATYIGIVKNNVDSARMGRLQVNIPSLTKTNNPSQNQLITCEYLSPFYGAKPVKYNKPNSEEYEDSQHSYGFWGVPPDLETQVLVMFAEGKANKAYWIGCIQDPYTNHMVPGIAASTNTAGDNKQKDYGTDNVPAGEINRSSDDALRNNRYNSSKQPIHPFAEILVKQGLIKDTVRGTTTSSARRESPSQVFGISTPGRKNTKTTKQKIGTNDSNVTDYVVREPGHTFVMDDGDINGNNQLTRIRTASGHQLLMNDTEGVIYIANGSGNSWIEMSSEGKIYIYAQDGFNLRADGNFDLHSGGDINFHAKNNIKFTAENELVNNANILLNVGKNGMYNASQEGSIMTYAKQGISSYTDAQQLHGAGGRIDLAGSQVHFNSVGASSDWGPTWLNEQSAGIVIDESQNDVNITVGEGQVLEANTKKTKTSVPNLVTHEPFTRAPSAIIESVSQWQDPKEWARLSKTPGTLEFLAQQNRESDIQYIKELQYLADAKKYVADNGGTTAAISKAKELSDRFTKQYNDIFKVKSVVENLSTKNLTEILTSKVTAGRITSVVSTLGQAGSVLLGRTSARDIVRGGGTVGRFTQVASIVRKGITTAIGKFKFW